MHKITLAKQMIVAKIQKSYLVSPQLTLYMTSYRVFNTLTSITNMDKANVLNAQSPLYKNILVGVKLGVVIVFISKQIVLKKNINTEETRYNRTSTP